ncbi:MAG: hypothetical protein HN337_08625 [Deltaproteobacteria bacterium]|jgi:hypothetical protein|nr:hypothetical protein [Deltaproteobacteria bacterium]
MLNGVVGNAASAFSVGPWGSTHMIGITSSPIVDLQHCDAFVVFHPAGQASAHGVAQSIYQTGGAQHLDAYRGILSRIQRPQSTGNLLPTRSDGGSYPLLLNMVNGFHTLMPGGEGAIRNLVAHFLLEAYHRKAFTVAIPPMGIHLDGGLTADESAAMLLGGIKDYWNANPTKGPYKILIPLNGRESLTRAYERGLEEIFGMGSESIPVDLDSAEVGDDLSEHLAALDDTETLSTALSALRIAVDKDPASIGVSGAMRLAKVAEGFTSINVRPGARIAPPTRDSSWVAMGILEALVKKGDGATRYTAGSHLARIGRAVSERGRV